jgi:hypothetical protein
MKDFRFLEEVFSKLPYLGPGSITWLIALKITSTITATLWARMAAIGAPVLGWRRPKAAGRKLSTPAANGRRAATPNQEL